MRLLLIEDDARLAEIIRKDLIRAGFAVDHSGDGEEGEFLGNEQLYDIVVLDLGLPGRGGLDILKSWRASGNRTLVLVLTARDSWHERVDGLKAGADDYLGKPFHVEELLARINALIRRSGGQASSVLEVSGIKLDEDHQTLHLDNGAATELTGTEFRLLRYFMLNPGKILSKSHLTEHLYDQAFNRDSNLIEVYIRRLREKIGKERIRTLRGRGYVFD